MWAQETRHRGKRNLGLRRKRVNVSPWKNVDMNQRERTCLGKEGMGKGSGVFKRQQEYQLGPPPEGFYFLSKGRVLEGGPREGSQWNIHQLFR